MAFIKYVFFTVAILPIQLCAQSVTAQLQLNPIPTLQHLPASLGGGIEIGLSPTSSVQINGLYRVNKIPVDGYSKGPKAYLAYRYYINPQGQKNRGYYVSPFVGYGSQQSLDYESPSDDWKRLNEKLAGVLLGFQPYKSNRFTVDIYGGPEYQWRAIKNTNATLSIQESNTDRLWLRAGFYFCYRIKR